MDEGPKSIDGQRRNESTPQAARATAATRALCRWSLEQGTELGSEVPQAYGNAPVDLVTIKAAKWPVLRDWIGVKAANRRHIPGTCFESIA
jgi:hypothetical protein